MAQRDRPAARGRQGSGFSRPLTMAIFALAGFMIVVAALAARGTDLRADRVDNMRQLVSVQADRNEELRLERQQLRDEVDALTAEQHVDPALTAQVGDASLAAGVVPVTGPGVRVVLDDAPLDVNPAGVDEDALVVHQQDIQAVVNALWEGGAEAMSIQGQRVISTTGIKCVGNSVVLHGVPYAPPYVIEAIGPADTMLDALANSSAVQIYRQYADAFGLGYLQESLEQVEVPGFNGTVNLSHATRQA